VIDQAPDVSVVIVAWQARDYVLRCLESLERNADLSYEAVVVDDGSGDGTPEAIGKRFPEARVVVKERNEGLCAGRNDGVRAARGRLVLMLDSDTEMRQGAMSALARVLDEDPRVGLVGPRLVYPDGELQLSCRRYPPLMLPFLRRGPLARLNPDPASHRRHLMMDFDHQSERPVVWVAGAAQMWRATLPSEIGLYDDQVSSYGGEDLDWCLRVWGAGLEVRYVADAEVMHVWQKVTRKRQFGRQSIRALRDWYYVQWKHRALRGSPLLAEANR
jgi:GT2 family glycosyltransferase